MVAAPATVSLYLKLALELPGKIDTVVMFDVSVASRKMPPPDPEPRLTDVVPAVTGELAAFWRCTVIVPLVTPAVVVCGDVVKTSFVAAALTVTWALGVPAAVHEWYTAVTVYEYVPSGTPVSLHGDEK